MSAPEDANLPIAGVADVIPSPGSRPLRNPRREAYCRKIAECLPKIAAYREAGFESVSDHAARGNADKLERKAEVQARIAHLVRQEEEILRAKRRRLEAWLWSVHESNYADFFEGGKLRPFEDLTPEQQAVIESLRFTEKGKPILQLYSKAQANAELRKLNGIGAVTREADDNEFSRMSDHDLRATLAQLSAELGINIDLALRFSPA